VLNSSSLVSKKVVAHQVWLQIAELWLSMSKEDENLLITDNTLLKQLNNDKKVYQTEQPETESFLLLITPQVNAFICREKTVNPQKYQITTAFKKEVILEELDQLGQQKKWNIAVIKNFQTNFASLLIHNRNHFAQFIDKTVDLLINSSSQGAIKHIQPHTPPMDKLLHYQVEQERIFEQIKVQISQNIKLSAIVQSAIDQSCIFLGLDRLLIYQLDVAIQSSIVPQQQVKYIDTVTYEAKENAEISSTLYFQDEVCWRNVSECRNKYNQGFSLIIDDVHTANLNSCLQALMHKLDVRAKAVTPINVMGKLWGFVIAHQCFKPRQWNSQETQFLRQIAEYLAIAIHYHQSYQQLQQQKLLLEKQVQTQAHQIKDALIAAEAASKSKHEFLGSMSHELRTPLTCVIGLSSTLLQWSSASEKGNLSLEKQQEYLSLIQQSGKHLLSLINNILEFSEVESGKHLLNIKQISLTTVARQSLQLLQEIAGAKQITLIPDIRLKTEQDCFFADEIRLKEILFNLLSNGIKFTPPRGDVILRIWREKRQVVVQVEDNGIGIADQEIPLLFEKFKQLEDFRQRTQGGTGLGLALTKKLVELHGGTIEVESAAGQGSVFTVYFPEKKPFQPHLNVHSVIANNASLASQTIMLVTEDEENATYICQLLNTIDCQVVWLMDSTTAINQIELLKPRILILDRDCSEVAAKNVAESIVRKSLTDEINLVLLWNKLENDEWQKFADYGFDDYLLKSMKPAQIIDKMNALIKV